MQVAESLVPRARADRHVERLIVVRLTHTFDLQIRRTGRRCSVEMLCHLSQSPPIFCGYDLHLTARRDIGGESLVNRSPLPRRAERIANPLGVLTIHIHEVI
ncbi:hypothetical protein D3C76_1056300 [compost metagenome]